MTGGVVHSKWHSCGFKQTKRGFEGSFPLVFFLDTYLVETPSQVHFSEDSFPLKLVNDASYQG
jgi:hypothetical protein